MSKTTNSKPYDIVVFGATGFTGALIARYLLQSPDHGLTWAIAGRNAQKLENVKHALKEKLPHVAAETIDAVPVLVADSSDEAQLTQLVQQTKVVLTVVGPYKLYGELLVKVCAENGTHYCDLTGEIIWIDAMIAKYEAAAVKSGAILVHCCGFESVPSDLTTFLLADAVKKTTNAPPSEITLAFTGLKGEASGGTLASVFTILETSTTAELVKSRNPFVLTDDKTRAQKDADGLTKKNSGSLAIKKEKDLGKWSSFFIGGSVNQTVVHRSNFLQQNAYGEKFVYRERGAMGGWFAQLGMTLGIMIGGVLLYFSWTRALIKKLAPQPGQGPSEEVMANGKFVAKAVAYDSHGKLAARATVVGAGDPGYGMTSKVITEAAICLAKRELTSANLKGGFHTTASALGHNMVKRLQDKHIITFDIQPVSKDQQ
jgi:short subunit dehydrogenase-like uncharacterized protein